MARLALVLPVLAQAARVAPTLRARVNTAVIPLSLNDPLGRIPPYRRTGQPGSSPAAAATGAARWCGPLTAAGTLAERPGISDPAGRVQTAGRRGIRVGNDPPAGAGRSPLFRAAMPAHLLSLTDGPSILVDKPILLFGRHEEC